MFDYLQFPKLIKRYESSPSPELHSKCMALIDKYQTSNSAIQFPNSYKNNLDEIERAINESLDTKFDLAKVLDIIPKYYISMELGRLSNLLNRILSSHNYVEILCHLYISHMYQIWFFEETALNKYMNSNYKRIQLFKSKQNPVLLTITDILTYLNNFKHLGEYKTSLDSQVFKEYGYGDEYLIINVIDQLMNQPFNEFNAEVPNDLQTLVNDCKTFQINFASYKNLSFKDIDYLLPTASNTTFEEYFLLVLKFKFFLNIIRISSKISGDQLKALIGDDNINKYILLIGSLNLNSIGIGYNINQDYFFNTGKPLIVTNDMVKINQMLESERLALIIKNELINRLL